MAASDAVMFTSVFTRDEEEKEVFERRQCL